MKMKPPTAAVPPPPTSTQNHMCHMYDCMRTLQCLPQAYYHLYMSRTRCMRPSPQLQRLPHAHPRAQLRQEQAGREHGEDKAGHHAPALEGQEALLGRGQGGESVCVCDCV